MAHPQSGAGDPGGAQFGRGHPFYMCSLSLYTLATTPDGRNGNAPFGRLGGATETVNETRSRGS